MVSRHSLNVHEPSGLALDASRESLWTAGNQAQRVYRLDLDGQVMGVLRYEGEDIEGVASDPFDGSLWIVEEASREVVHLDATGRELSRRELDLTGAPNSGLEGICLDTDGIVYVVNEKSPPLFVQLGPDLSISHQHQIEFAADCSGLDYDSRRNAFWVLSDESRKLFLWSPELGLLGEYPLAFSKGEGVAADTVNDLVYIVSEAEDALYVYRIVP